MKRVYLPVDLWEEIHANMWGAVADKESALQVAIEITGDHERYGELMNRVIEEWPNSTLNALTDLSINRKAWIGHAAMALGYGIPEDIVRKAWGMLTNEQRRLANNQAENAIQTWYASRLKSESVHFDMGEQVLLEWDSRRSATVARQDVESAELQGDCDGDFTEQPERNRIGSRRSKHGGNANNQTNGIMVTL